MSSLGVWLEGAIMGDVAEAPSATGSACPSDALRFFLEDSPVVTQKG